MIRPIIFSLFLTANITSAFSAVSLARFTATPLSNNNCVELNWIKSTEINNDYFTVERSIDGINFEAVTIVDGGGNSTKMLTYSAIDKNPQIGLSYYRLMQTDTDKDTHHDSIYSDIVAVEFHPVLELSI